MRLQEDCSQSYVLRNRPSIGPNGGERSGNLETQEVACFAQHVPVYPGDSLRLTDVLTTYEFQMDATVEDLQFQVNETHKLVKMLHDTITAGGGKALAGGVFASAPTRWA